MENTNIINLENLDASKLPELQGLKDKQIELVKECPYIEIIDNSSYEIAKKHRTALLKGRTSLESQEKTIASKLAAFRKKVGEVTKELIDITLPHEEKQQTEVKRWEEIKEAEKAEKERLEQERVNNIKNKINSIETECYTLISTCTFQTLETTKKEVDSILNTEFDFEEFDVLLDMAKQRVLSAFENKLKELQEKENQRLENERLAREKAEAEAKQKSLEEQLAKEREEAQAKEKAIQEQQEKERLEREQKEREEKNKVFEVRKKRLEEIGLKYSNNQFDTGLIFIPLDENVVYNADVIDFENILTDAKQQIQEAKEKAEKELQEKQASEQAEKEAKKKAEKENKERVKRLSKDKAIYKKTLNETLGGFPVVFDADQKEIRDFSEYAAIKVEELKNQLLTELENL